MYWSPWHYPTRQKFDRFLIGIFQSFATMPRGPWCVGCWNLYVKWWEFARNFLCFLVSSPKSDVFGHKINSFQSKWRVPSPNRQAFTFLFWGARYLKSMQGRKNNCLIKTIENARTRQCSNQPFTVMDNLHYEIHNIVKFRVVTISFSAILILQREHRNWAPNWTTISGLIVMFLRSAAR
jgi:hypothetical protein